MFWNKKPQKRKKSKSPPKVTKSPAPQKKPKPYSPPPLPPKVDMPKPFAEKQEEPAAPKTLPPSFDGEKEFLRVFKELTYRHRAWDVWRDFIVMSACALSNPVDKTHFDEREARYLRAIGKYSKPEQRLFPELFAHTVMALEQDPEQDFLGNLYLNLNLCDEGRQQHFTPYSVCRMMADITVDDIAENVRQNGYVTINDCCCGAGATLIASVHAAKRKLEQEGLNFQNHILIAAQDIDEIVALMCYIQLSLLGMAAYVKVGNALTDPMTDHDSLENYWFTPMYFSNVWTMRRTIQQAERLLKGENQ